MARRCPPGVICIENMTVMFLIAIVVILGLYYYYFHGRPSGQQPAAVASPTTVIVRPDSGGLRPRFTSGYNEIPGDVLLNPYMPPLKRSGFFPPFMGDPRGVPINIRTRGFRGAYTQVGLLTRSNGKETMLPLMGRSLHTGRDKWQYYTMSDKGTSIKLPVSKKGRSCTNEYGCDELFNGDSVYVEGYKDAFNVTIYENAEPRYIPYL